MTLIPRLAVFRPDDGQDDSILKLFQRHEYSIRTVSTTDEIQELTAEEDSPFDVIVVPLRLKAGASGVSACLQVKSCEDLASIPLLGISFSNDKPVIQSFYEMGADVVLIAPIDSDMLRFQIGAMTRQRRAFGEQLRANQESSGFSRSIITAFNIVREGLLIFNSNYEFSFGNASARMLLGLGTDAAPEEILEVEKLFRPLLVQHAKSTSSFIRKGAIDLPISRFESSLVRTDGRSFRTNVRATTLFSTDDHVMGFAASITDMSELDQLSNALVQAQRIGSLCLLGCACAVQSLQGNFENIFVSPLVQLDRIFAKDAPQSSPSPVLSTLVEFLDLVVSPEVSVKVACKVERKIAMPPADLFQLFGHILLHVVQFAGRSGEAFVEISDKSGNEGITVIMTGQSRKVTPFIPNDYLANLVQGELSVPQSGTESEKMNIGLGAAQTIARKFGADVEYRTTPDGKLKVRVRLPAVM